MQKITKFDRTVLNFLSSEIDAAVAKVAEKYGLTYQPKSGRFDSFNYTKSLALSIKSPEAEKALGKYANWFGLPDDIIGRTFEFQGRTYRVTEIKPNRPKFPVSGVRVSDNQPFKFPAETVKRLLK